MPLIRPKKRLFQIGFKQIKKIVPKGVNKEYFQMICYTILYLFIFLVCSSEYYPASPMDKLLSAAYLISSEWEKVFWYNANLSDVFQ